MKKMLLHSCCGPCSTSVIERLVPDYDITVFFYNPCITDRDEYEKRKDNQIKFIEEFNRDNNLNIDFVEGKYDSDEYFRRVDGLENEPEGGARCTVCFHQRLEEAARYAGERGFDIFTTTLTVSPHKDYPLISGIGREYGEKYGVEFLNQDFKKKAGFQRSIELSREHELYRQNYCGCVYSIY